MITMNRLLILFRGGVETQEFFSLELAKVFDRMGYKIFFYNLLEDEESYRALCSAVSAARETSADVVMFSFNYNGLAGEPFLYRNDGSIYWDDAQIPCYNMVLDHPFYYHKYIAHLPKRYYQISIDRNHELYMRRFFPQITLGGFVPLGGTQLDTGGEVIAMRERIFPVVMTGNYTQPETFERYIAHLPKEYIDFYHAILQEQLNHPDRTLEEIAEPMLRQTLTEGDTLTDKDIADCYANMIFIDLWARFAYRGKAVAALADAGIEVHTFGEGWDKVPARHPQNIIQHGGKNSLQCLEALAQAKLSLNVMPWFKDGAHDRIYNSMLNRAVCLTDESIYLKETLSDGENILFYRLEDLDRMAQRAAELLSEPDRLEQIADSAYCYAAANCTWAERAKVLDGLFAAATHTGSER